LLYPYDQFTPGPKINNSSDLISVFKEYFSGIDKYKENRKWVRDLLFQDLEPNARKKIVETIKNYKKKSIKNHLFKKNDKDIKIT